MKHKLSLLLLFISAILTSGCGTVANLAGINDKAVVIAERAQIRSSGAVVAADLLEVKRGTKLEILGDEVVNDEKWYSVRAFDENATEGWIEARNVLPDKLLAQSQKLAEEFKDRQAQATGQLAAATNLRLTHERTDDSNILQKLKGGDNFEIVSWKRIPKPANPEADDEKDDKTKNAANKPETRRERRQRERDANAPVRLDDKYDIWYQVRLQPAVSPAPVGWIYGKQVELTVPNDIVFQRTGREFVAWGRLDGKGDQTDSYAQSVRDAGKENRPGAWVILERSTKAEDPNGTDESDFDHIRIIGYDKDNQDHYKVYRSGAVKGFLPLRITGTGDSRTFTVKIRDANGELKDFNFATFKDTRGLLKVTVPDGIPKEDKNDR